MEAERQGKSFSEHSKAPHVNPAKQTAKRSKQNEEKEQRDLAINMMSKKNKRLYDRAMFGKEKKAQEINTLKEKATKARKA
jgi:pescadillo protein